MLAFVSVAPELTNTCRWISSTSFIRFGIISTEEKREKRRLVLCFMAGGSSFVWWETLAQLAPTDRPTDRGETWRTSFMSVKLVGCGHIFPILTHTLHHSSMCVCKKSFIIRHFLWKQPAVSLSLFAATLLSKAPLFDAACYS